MEKIETEAMETRPGNLRDDVTDTWLDLHTKQRRVHCTQKSYVYTKNMVVGNRGWSGTEEETIIKILSDKQIDYSLIIHFRSQK